MQDRRGPGRRRAPAAAPPPCPGRRGQHRPARGWAWPGRGGWSAGRGRVRRTEPGGSRCRSGRCEWCPLWRPGRRRWYWRTPAAPALPRTRPAG
ncbi:hypothetical protein [Ornithinimicrobium kibberense]|uniref:hypothetical protein n=1 Tax=Ornithinimicrobium kibberense TaxID=282060 RepID=UPI0036149967